MEDALSVAERKAQAEATIAANEQRIAQLEQRSKTHALKNEFAQVEHLRTEIGRLQAGISNMRVLVAALDELTTNAKAEAKRLRGAYSEADGEERRLQAELDAANARYAAAEAELMEAERAAILAKNGQSAAFSRLCRIRAELDRHKIDFPQLHKQAEAA